MEFENDLKVIANDIYKRVVKYINDNKDNDDIMYEYAYLKLSNGLQVMYNFESGALYYTHPNEHGDYFFSYILKINNDNFELNLKNIEYDTLLCQKIKNSRSFNQRHAFEKDLLKQQNLSVREKEKIKRCFEKLNGLIESITYNKEKTRNENNYNSETFVVYNEYMYKKELNKQEEVLPGVKIAAEWWANAIIEEICYESIEDDYNDLNTNYEEQIKKFKEIFSKKLIIYHNVDSRKIQYLCNFYSLCYLIYVTFF